MNAWSHLPNACHIDRIIESVKSHPEIWDAARGAAWDAALGAARYAAWNAAWNAAWGAVMNAAMSAAMNAALGAARYAAWGAALGAALGAIAALIAYDDASKYLEMTSDQLRVWAILSEDPAAVLLLPAVVAFERISELECV
jgi:hypothetical protein